MLGGKDVLPFGGVEVKLQIFGSNGADVNRPLENVITVTGATSSAYRRLSALKWSSKSSTKMINSMGPMIEPWCTPILASAFFGKVSIDVHLEGSSVEGTFDLAYYTVGNAISFTFSKKDPTVVRLSTHYSCG